MNGMEEKMAWKLKKNKEIERKSHFGPLIHVWKYELHPPCL